MSSGLEPSLTVYDRRVLMAVPGGDTDTWLRDGTIGRTTWQIAEALDTLDVADLSRTLHGLEHLGYVTRKKSRKRGREVWWRTQRGDAAL